MNNNTYTKEKIEYYKKEIRELIKSKPHSYHFLLLKRKELLDFIQHQTSWIKPKDNVKFAGKIFFVLNDITEFPKCEMCKKPIVKSVHALADISSYNRHCSKKCANNNPLSKERLRQTNLKKYGVPISSQSQQAKEAYKRRMEEKYGLGIINSFQAKEVIEKLERTKLEKYGSKHYNNRAKSEKTCLQKYGVRVSSQAASIIEKSIRRHQYLIDNIKFDSSWEVAYYIWLRDNKIDFQYHPTSIEYFDQNGKSHFYHPDFLVEGKLIEIKGDDQFRNGKMIDKLNPKKNFIAEAKQQCMKENDVCVILSADMKPYFDFVKRKYGNLETYIKQFEIVKDKTQE